MESHARIVYNCQAQKALTPCKTERLNGAVAAYREVLKENTRERVPLDWATTQSHLGVALAALGKREHSKALYRAALQATDGALEAFRANRTKRYIARTAQDRARIVRAIGRMGD